MSGNISSPHLSGGFEMGTVSQSGLPANTGLPVDSSRLGRGSSDSNRQRRNISNLHNNEDANENSSNRPEITAAAASSSSKAVRRKLKPIHLFMISINGTLGTGLYLKSGQILELGGPLSVLISFLIIGFLAWAVMQCITELLSLWPVPGALCLFVTKFVDEELGVAVGVAYWFTYSIGFAALIASAASYFNYWAAGVPGFTVAIVYIILPIIMVLINTLRIEIYGWLEVITGGIKISFLITIIITLVAIHSKFGISSKSAADWTGPLKFDEFAATGWVPALLMSLSIATFAYAGVEIIAASAIEARWAPTFARSEPHRTGLGTEATASSLSHVNRERADQRSVGTTIKFTAVYIPVIVAIAYIITGLLVSINLERNDCDLPRLSWTSDNCSVRLDANAKGSTPSAFVLVAKRSHMPGLQHSFNFFLAFTALTCANTNLYVASRTLFGLTRNIRGSGFISSCLKWFGITDQNRVPTRAMLFSALAFCWVPFLQEEGGFDTATSLGRCVEILSQMGSVSVLIVWICQCLAYIRYHRYIHKRLSGLVGEEIYCNRNRSHWQPLLAYLAFGGCLVVLVVCNGAFLWKQFDTFAFLSAYLTTILFLALWAGLKVWKNARWSFTDLNNEAVDEAVTHLNELRNASMKHPNETA